jgi:hypothetical protein
VVGALAGGRERPRELGRLADSGLAEENEAAVAVDLGLERLLDTERPPGSARKPLASRAMRPVGGHQKRAERA